MLVAMVQTIHGKLKLSCKLRPILITARRQATKKPYTIDAYAMIDKLCKGPADVKIILECYLSTRFQGRYDLIKEARKLRRNVEIIGTGQTGQDDEGGSLTNRFTEEMVNKLADVLERAHTMRKRMPTTAFSILQLMADCDIDANPYRIWLSEYEPPKPKDPPAQLWRMRINPLNIIRANKLVFHKDCTRDSAKEKELAYYQERREHNRIKGPAANLYVSFIPILCSY